jgi:hypothetical protein
MRRYNSATTMARMFGPATRSSSPISTMSPRANWAAGPLGAIDGIRYRMRWGRIVVPEITEYRLGAAQSIRPATAHWTST